jgi:hypothetical protein
MKISSFWVFTQPGPEADLYRAFREAYNSPCQVCDTMNRISCVIAIALLMAGNAAQVFACGPAPAEDYAKTEKRVRDRFKSVDSVVLLTLLDVKRVSKIEMGVELPGEKSVFRIDRVFKGPGRPGDKLTLTTYTTCATYVVRDWDEPKGPVISRHWLIYRDHSQKQMPAHDMARPIEYAALDLKVLPKIARVHYNRPR